MAALIAAMSSCAPKPAATLPAAATLQQSTSAPGAPPPGASLTSAPTLPPEATTFPPVLSTATQPPEEAKLFPDPAGYQWIQWIPGLNRPVDATGAGDGSKRLFILEQRGVVRMALPGSAQLYDFLDITGRVGSAGNEQGLLGIAFSSQYSQDGRFYLDYTELDGGTVVSRFKVSDDPNRADPASEEILLRIKQPYPNHNGGGLAFGPDGYLYISSGDGGSGGDPQGNGQSLDTLLGKLLRIDVSPQIGYAIPPGNPYAGGGGLPEIWAYGLRNPWRFSFDRLTGDLYIADVGQAAWEELNIIRAPAAAGLNFGWKIREGSHPYQQNQPSGLNLVDPAYEYNHDQGCSITGGFVYRGKELPEMYGIYLFGDYCSGTIWGVLPDGGGGVSVQPLFKIGALISSFALDEDGEIYLLDHQNGLVWRLWR